MTADRWAVRAASTGDTSRRYWPLDFIPAFNPHGCQCAEQTVFGFCKKSQGLFSLWPLLFFSIIYTLEYKWFKYHIT